MADEHLPLPPPPSAPPVATAPVQCVVHESAAQKVAGSLSGLGGAFAICYLATLRVISGDTALVALLLLLLPIEVTRRVVALLQARLGVQSAAVVAAGVAAAEKARGVGAAMLVVGSLAAGLGGCPQNPYRANPCGNPGAYRCFDNAPQVCSGGTWVPVGDVPCNNVGGVCALDSDGVASCHAHTAGSLAQ